MVRPYFSLLMRARGRRAEAAVSSHCQLEEPLRAWCTMCGTELGKLTAPCKAEVDSSRRFCSHWDQTHDPSR